MNAIIYLDSSLLTVCVASHGLWRYIEVLDAKYNQVLLVWPHEVEPWSHSCRVETLDAKYNQS